MKRRNYLKGLMIFCSILTLSILIICLVTEVFGKYATCLSQEIPEISIIKKPTTIDIALASNNPIADIEYAGTIEHPVPVLIYAGETLVEGVDYTYTYTDKAPTGGSSAKAANSILVTGIGKYTGTKTITYYLYNKMLHVIICGAIDEVPMASIAPYTFDVYKKTTRIAKEVSYFEGDYPYNTGFVIKNIVLDEYHYIYGYTNFSLVRDSTFYLHIGSY